MKFKYNEDNIINDILEHVKSTYGQHYVGNNKIQVIDLIESIGAADGFYRGSVLKYSSRYGKKQGNNEIDLFKAIHFLILLINYKRSENVVVPEELRELSQEQLEEFVSVFNGDFLPPKKEQKPFVFIPGCGSKDSLEHTLKCVQPYYDHIVTGKKTFEIRKYDRYFNVGDILILREYDKDTDTYSGNCCDVEITYMTNYDQKEGYVVLGIKKIGVNTEYIPDPSENGENFRLGKYKFVMPFFA